MRGIAEVSEDRLRDLRCAVWTRIGGVKGLPWREEKRSLGLGSPCGTWWHVSFMMKEMGRFCIVSCKAVLIEALSLT